MSNCKQCRDRRDFLKLGSMTLVISAIEPGLLRANPALGRIRTNTLRPTGKTLVHIWQRGGQDGLNVVIPTEAGEYATYQSYRPTMAIPMASLSPQQLTPDFALNPALNPGLWDLYTQGKLAVLPTVGYPGASRSHFDGQKFLENGTPWNKTTGSGWLNRWLQAAGPSADPLQAISLTSSVPALMGGPAPTLAFSSIGGLEVTSRAYNEKFLASQELAYAVAPPAGRYHDAVTQAGSGLITAIREIEMRQPLPDPDPAAIYPNTTFGRQMRELAQLMKAGFQVEIANLELNSWDTHTNQDPIVTAKLGEFSQTVNAFTIDIGSLMQDTVLASVSEFGRTARENGNRGTDHGNAWTGFVIGNRVNAGVYVGTGWPGLDSLRDNRDLVHTVDFRDLYAELLGGHMGLYTPDIFPSWTQTPLGIF